LSGLWLLTTPFEATEFTFTLAISASEGAFAAVCSLRVRFFFFLRTTSDECSSADVCPPVTLSEDDASSSEPLDDSGERGIGSFSPAREPGSSASLNC
jgi:hypothetical protein